MNFDFSPALISIKISIVSTIVIFFSGILCAYVMLKVRGTWRMIAESFLTLPLILPPTVVGFILLLLLGKNGPIGAFLDTFGITLIFTWQAASIAAIVVSFPLMYKSTKGAFEQIDPELIAIARVYGANEWQILWKIMVPLALPGVLSGLILSFARSLGEFGATIMVAGSIPSKTQSMPIALYFASQSGETKTALLWAFIIYIVSFVIIIASSLLQKVSRKD